MAKDNFTKKWIIENAIPIINSYDKGILTIRGLHYRLVSIGMTNTIDHYKRVVNAMIDARWAGIVPFDTFSDNDREMIGETKYSRTDVGESVEDAKEAINDWMKYYNKNRWENQKYYPEVFIEKKALQGVFDKACRSRRVTLGACKGYPSLTFLYEASLRFKEAISQGKEPIILYFGDYDPSGEDIPRSIVENMSRFGVEGLTLERVALMEHQVVEWKLPPAPTKDGDSRSAKWTGLGQVELDSIMPEKLIDLCMEAIDSIFDVDLHNELKAIEKAETMQYQKELKEYVQTL